MEIPESSLLFPAFATAIRQGDSDALRTCLQQNPELSTARFIDSKGHGRTALHIATDWPGHFPNAATVIKMLLAAGADPNAVFTGVKHHNETPLHSAASSDDVEALDALLDGGADIEKGGAVFTNGPAMSDAVIFANWNAARRLLERGAKTTLTQSAALGLQDRLEVFFAGPDLPPKDQITAGLWHASRGGQRQTAEYLLARGADLNWVGWDHLTPLDCARKSGNLALVEWLRSLGAVSAR